MIQPAHRRAGSAFLPALLLLLLAGCQASGPGLTYAQWQEEQAKKAQMKKAGVEYKSPEQLRAEAEQMRQAADQAAKQKPEN